MDLPQEFEGFKILTLRTEAYQPCHHTIFAKINSIRAKDPDKPSGRTLFLLNIPPYITESVLREFFESFGEVSNVFFAEKPGKDETASSQTAVDKFLRNSFPFKFKVAYVIFKSTKVLQKVLELKTIDLVEANGNSKVISGVSKWTAEYIDSIVDEDTLEAEINEYMASYDENEAKAIEAEKSSKADDEGWITVTKRGKHSSFEQKESIINRIEEKMEKSSKTKELKNFYTFQIRESKMKKIASLRKKFEDDKQKIETLKKSKRFKPF